MDRGDCITSRAYTISIDYCYQ